MQGNFLEEGVVLDTISVNQIITHWFAPEPLPVREPYYLETEAVTFING